MQAPDRAWGNGLDTPLQISIAESRKSTGKTAGRAKPAATPRRPTPRLNAMMECDTAFRVIARRYLDDLMANQEATCNGDPTALHQMRIALTRLRTSIWLFSPMVTDSQRTKIRGDLKWLNAHLGTARDLDVATERLQAIDRKQPQDEPYYRAWNDKRANSHRLLARALRSARYRRLIKDSSGWIENGSWSTRSGKQAAKERALPIAEYSAEELTRRLDKLLKKSRKLLTLDAEKRHRLRLLNKKLSYSIGAFEDLFPDKRFAKLQAGLKHLRKAQRSLGQLNDDERGRALAASLQSDGAHPPWRFLGPKREERLLQTAATAYRKLAALTD
jgi:CHAD domain-containing protein